LVIATVLVEPEALTLQLRPVQLNVKAAVGPTLTVTLCEVVEVWLADNRGRSG